MSTNLLIKKLIVLLVTHIALVLLCDLYLPMPPGMLIKIKIILSALIILFIISKVSMFLAKLDLTVMILYGIFLSFQIDLSSISAAILLSNPWWFVASVGTQLLAICFSILRWNTLLRGQDLILPTPHLTKTYLAGRFLGTFTPTGVGLEAYKAYDVARYTGKAAESVAVIIIEKIIATFFSLSTLVLISLAFIKLPSVWLRIFFIAFFVLLSTALILLFKPSFIEKILGFNFPLKNKIEGKLREVVNAFTIYNKRKACLLKAIFFGFFIYLALIATYFTNALALHAGIGFTDVLKVGPLTQVFTMLPISIAGIGLREKAFMDLLTNSGATFNETATFLTAFMWYPISVSVNIVGAIIFLVRRTDYEGIRAENVQELMREGKISS